MSPIICGETRASEAIVYIVRVWYGGCLYRGGTIHELQMPSWRTQADEMDATDGHNDYYTLQSRGHVMFATLQKRDWSDFHSFSDRQTLVNCLKSAPLMPSAKIKRE